ncbi:MAG: NAD(P)H-dependent glycerol-3-phosphate dehydrogenase [Mangrovicoccus sp.]
MKDTSIHDFSPIAPAEGPRPYGRVAVIGTGSWGTAVASLTQRAGCETVLLGRDHAIAEAITLTGENPKYLKDIALPKGLRATTNKLDALFGAEAVFLVTPSQSLRQVARDIKTLLAPGVPVVLCAKGIEIGTGLLLSQAVAEELPGHPIGALSGPTFATDTAQGHYTAATLAFEFRHEDRLNPNDSPAARLAVTMSSETFRPYISDDLTGVEVAGAMKNVIAIACGMMTGAGFAENTRAALIARGLDEMKTLAEALGGRRETVTGLSGVGDLTLTCSSQTSRNMSLGHQLGQGLPRSECFQGRPVVVEGETNARSIIDLARRLGISLPICETVFGILHEDRDLAASFATLWTQPIESEPRALTLELPHPITTETYA